MGLSNRDRDFTDATIEALQNSLTGPTDESREFRSFWSNYGSCFDTVDFTQEAAQIDEFISRNRHLMSVVTPAKLTQVSARMHELDETFGRAIDNTSEELRAYGKSLDALTQAISDGGFPASFDKGKLEAKLSFHQISNAPERKLFLEIYKNQFGFMDETCELLYLAYSSIKRTYPDATQAELDWRFSRSMSALVYDNLAFESAAGMSYDDGAGYILRTDSLTGDSVRITPEYYYTKVLGFTTEQFLQLQYEIKLQHAICNPIDAYSVNDIDIYGNPVNTMGIEREKEEFYRMKKVYNYNWDYEKDQEIFEKEWAKRYDAMFDKPDFAHMQCIFSIHLANEQKRSSILALLFAGGSAQKLDDKSSWLGDAVGILGPLVPAKFSNDDYMADLDAENILYSMKNNNTSLQTATIEYYEQKNNENRANLFLQHTPIEQVKREILDELIDLFCTDVDAQTVVHANELTSKQVEDYYAQYITYEKYPDTFMFVQSLEAGRITRD